MNETKEQNEHVGQTAKVLVEKHYPTSWVFQFKPIPAGTIVPVVKATNIPDPDCFWVNTKELKNDAYGILLRPGEYEIVK